MGQDFENAAISGGSFLHVDGDYHHYSTGGIQTLNFFISHGALHDSAARYPPPRCLPGTRKKEQEDIMRWIDDPDPSSSIFLIQGPTGVGKTALAQSIAERLQAENRHSYACFFFRRGVVRCDNMDQLFSTLAYQLAINTAGIRQHVEQAIVEDPALPMKSAATQLQKLIIEPFKALPTPCSPILIIEGFDGCEEEKFHEKFQDTFLALISKVLLDPTVRIRFIISGISDHGYEGMCRHRLVLGWLVLDRHVDRVNFVARSTHGHDLFFFFVFHSNSMDRVPLRNIEVH